MKDSDKYIGIIVERRILSDEKILYIFDSAENGRPMKNHLGDRYFKTDGGERFFYTNDYDHCFSEDEFYCALYEKKDFYKNLIKKDLDVVAEDDSKILNVISKAMCDYLFVANVNHEQGAVVVSQALLDNVEAQENNANKNLLPVKVEDNKDEKIDIKSLINTNFYNVKKMDDYEELLKMKKEIEEDYHDRNIVNAYIKYKQGNKEIFPFFQDEFVKSKRVKEIIKALRDKVISYDNLGEYYDANSNILDCLDDYLKLIDYKTENGIDTIEKRKMEEEELKYIFTTLLNVKNSNQIFDEMTKTVISQDDAIKRLITEINRFSLLDDKSNKKGILLTGSTGVGKTLIIKTLSKLLDKPVCIIDSSQLVINGYRGTHIDEYLESCFASLNYDVEKLENAIIYFDEIDKKGMDNESDVSGKGVLDSLLKFLDGTVYNLEVGEGLTRKVYQVKTDNMLVIAGGSFSKVYGRKPHQSIGFLADLHPKLEIKDEDFMTYGNMTKEFMGRFPIVIHLNDLEEKDYKRILLESDISPLKIERDTFKKIGVQLDASEQFLKEVSKQACDSGKGARGLSGIISTCTSEAFSYATNNFGEVDNIKLTKRTAEDNSKFTVVKQKSKVKSLH